MKHTRITTHPGEFIKYDFLEPLGLSAAELARELGIPGNRLTEIINGRRGISADTAHRLARHFRMTPEFWMNAQASHDLTKAAAENNYSKIRKRKLDVDGRLTAAVGE